MSTSIYARQKMHKVIAIKSSFHLDNVFCRFFFVSIFSLFFFRHVMFAPSLYDSYSDNSFPGIVDTMNEIENQNATAKWEVLKQQVSIATFIIQSAANTLKEVGL